MLNHPSIKPGDRISVENHNCIVQKLYPQDSEKYICWVIYKHQSKTLKCPVSWNGKEWIIPDADLVTWARESEPFVQELKKLGKK